MNTEVATSVAKNTISMMLSQGITWISSLVLMLVLPRYLGSEEYGHLFLAISIAMILQMAVEYGGMYQIAKEVARDRVRAPEILANSVALRSVMWCCSMALLCVFLGFAGYPFAVNAAVLILGTSKLWVGAENAIAGGFQGFEMMQYPAIGSIAERVLLAILGISALVIGARSVTIAAVMAFCTFVNFGVVVHYARRILPPLPAFRWAEVKALTKDGLPYLLWSVFAVLYYRMDAVMLSLMTPATVVGWYGAAYRIFDILMFLPSLLMSAVFPVLSKLWRKDERTLAGTTQKSIEVMFLAGLPLSILIFANAREIISLLFGLDAYAPSVKLLQIFSVGLLLVYIDFVLVSTLIAADKHRQWTLSAFIAMLLNPLLNYFLIPYAQRSLGNGGIGAAIATLATEFCVMCMALYLLPKEVFRGSTSGALMKILISASGMAAAIWICNDSGGTFYVASFAGAVVYAGLLLAFGVFSAEELAFARTYVSKRTLTSVFNMKERPAI